MSYFFFFKQFVNPSKDASLLESRIDVVTQLHAAILGKAGKASRIILNLTKMLFCKSDSHCFRRIIGFLTAASFAILTHGTFAQGEHVLAGHVPAVTRHLTPISRVPASNTLNLAIGLPLRNQDALTNFLRDLYDPSSPQYHHFLSPDEFTKNFGPTEQDYQAVINFANAHGLKVTGTHPNRVILDVSGPVSDIEQAFQVSLHVYQHPTEKRTFFAPDTEPTLPSDLPILDIGGLNNYVIPRPRFIKRPAEQVTNSPAKVGSGPNNLGYMGSDFRAAYAPGITNTGAGQSVALVEFDGFYVSDITSYQTYAHLSTSTPITKILLNGFNGSPGSANTEVALDIEVALAIAPGLSGVYVYEESYTTNITLVNDLLNRIATDNLAKQISCSWIVDVNASSDSIFQQYAAQGQSFYNASGDDGAYLGIVLPPSDDPYITQVGGTTLTTAGAGGPWSAEKAWNWGGGRATSGGVSPVFAMPSWQKGINMAFNMGSQTMRNFPDVSMCADNVFIVDNSGSLDSVGGTSCAAPLWAGFTALVNQQAAATGKNPVGFINPAIYNIALSSAYGSAIHDVTTGNNTNYPGGTNSQGYVYTGAALAEFFAGSGYDLCTGVGTPAGLNLMNALLATPDGLQVSPVYGFTASGNVGGPFNIIEQTYTLSNSGNASFNWTNGRTASWLSVLPANGTLTSHASATVTVSLNTAANTLAAGNHAGNVWFTNLSTAFGQSREFALEVGQPLVRNGSFETGDFSYWVVDGDVAGPDFPYGLTNYVGDAAQSGITPESGTYAAFLGQPALRGTLTQYIPTFPAQAYLLSYWWQNPDLGSGVTPNQFSVTWNGEVLLNKTNLAAQSTWTNFQFLVKAANTSTQLQFGAQNDNSLFGLDNISVTSFPQPAFTKVTETNHVITLSWSAVSGYEYELQYVTNILQTNWTTLGGMIKATNSTMLSTDSVTNSTQRFYRVALVL
jgi:Pro-kumamolisin, activation domain/Viral BACON domain